MDLQLTGKVAFVSGSTAGIGFAIAQRLGLEGADVVINGRTDERVRIALTQIKADVRNVDIRGIAADLGTAEGCAEVIRQLPQIDILVNNVGIFEPKPFEEIPDADWEKFFAVNIMSGVRLSRAYLAGVYERGREGPTYHRLSDPAWGAVCAYGWQGQHDPCSGVLCRRFRAV